MAGKARAEGIDRYEAIYREFRWHVPSSFNIAAHCCARWARRTPDAVAVRYEHEDGSRALFTYADLQHAANRLGQRFAAPRCRAR